MAQPVGETHTNASATSDVRPPQRAADSPSDAVGVVVDADLQRACDLPDEPAEAPRFDVDSARLRPRGEDVLAHVASCVVAGKLGDATLEIVGHTDPRGAASYNEQLGLYRAVAAKQTLASLGVPAVRLSVQSRGERDAKGKDDASWQLDRRVEIHRLTPPEPR